MKQAETRRETVLFAGPPRRLRSICRIPEITAGIMELELGEGNSASVAVEPAGGGLRARLDPKTPAGLYKGRITAGKQIYAAEVDVERTPRVRVSPAGLFFEIRDGAPAFATMVIENLGNVAVEIPDNAAVGIFDDDGVETAFASTYMQEARETNDLVKHFIDRLRDSHGGLLKLRVEGAGRLGLGECRRLRLDARASEKVKAGHSYHGVWTLQDINIGLEVRIEKANRKEAV